MTSDRASAAHSKGTAAPDPLIGRVIGGRFKVTALIARGGMGRVYRAEQAPLGRICAIKVLNPNYAGEHDPEFHRRFFLEASIASKLTHPNTVTIFDYGRTEDDIYYMAMEYLEGHTLHRAIRDVGHLPEGRCVHIARQIGRSLREAHALGVIHRDLKPANIFLVDHGDEPDFVKVLDFGLVKNVAEKGEDLTQTGMFMGSPKYMAPEQIRGDRVDARTDIYALGIILYEMLTGKVPFDRATSVNILMAHVHEAPPPLREMNPAIAVSASVQESVLRCLAKEPDMRFRSMAELVEALKTGPPAVTGSGSRSPDGARASEPPPAYLPGDTLSAGAHRAAQPAAGGASKAAVVAAVAGSLALVGVIGFVAVRPGPSAGAARVASAGIAPAAPGSASAATGPVPSSTAAPTGASEAPGTASAAEPRPLAAKLLRVTTEPEGANVKEDGAELCPSTPCDVLFKDADDPGKEHKLTVTRQGYRAETRTVRTGDAVLALKLAGLPRAAAPAAPPARAPEAPAVPTGYKTDIPY